MADVEPTTKIISRQSALADGLLHYYTGKICKRGHRSPRRTKDCGCVSCGAIRCRENRAKNPERCRARDVAWKAKNRERISAQEKDRYDADPEKYRAKSRKSYWRNPEQYRARSNKTYYELYKRPEVRKKAQARTKQWALENPEKARANARRAKVKRRNINVQGSHTAEDISEIFKAQKGKCAYCRIYMGKKYTVDHIIAIAKGGTNDRRNIQLACMPCNREKWARDPLFHARMLGMLL